MRTRSILPVLLMILLPVAFLPAQAHLSVDLQDSVYQLLEVAELKGILGTLSAVRPYSRSQVIALLDRLWEAREMLSDVEKAVLAETRQRFGEERDGLRYGNFAHHPVEKSAKRLAVGVDVQTNTRLNANSVADWYLDSAFRPYLRGDLGSSVSYLGILGFTFDRVASEEVYDASYATSPYALAYPPAFAPYGFTKQWDGYHISFDAERYSHGELDYPSISYDLETEITAELLQDDVRVTFARQRRDWGIGDGSLTLAGTARPFVGAETHVQLAPWISGHYLFGTLSNWDEEPQGLVPVGTISYQKLFALQRLELTPLPWLYLSASSSVVGARRFELTYLSPLLFGVLAQNLIGDLDNVGVGIDAAVTLPPFGRAYVSFYADEMELTSLGALFTRPRNMFALQGGLKLPVPRLPFTNLTLQYTKIEPFTYAHYPTEYSDYHLLVDTAYTHDGENLAYHLWPNSDEFLVKLASLPFQGFSAGLEYRLIRHGDNPSKLPIDLAILGRPDGYLDYTGGVDQYPDKDFLHDGLYDFNHIVTVSGEYAIPNSQVTVGLSYTFCYTYWEVNASGEADPGDTIRNIIGLKVKVFR